MHRRIRRTRAVTPRGGGHRGSPPGEYAKIYEVVNRSTGSIDRAVTTVPGDARLRAQGRWLAQRAVAVTYLGPPWKRISTNPYA
jgi:hypothetical protein